MQIPYRRIGIVAGFSLLLALLIVNAAVTRRQLGLQIGAQYSVSRTRQVLMELNQLELLLVDAETGQRGYLYTGDSKYLAPYQDAISKIEPQLDTVAKLTADNSSQQAMIPELRNRVHAKAAEMAQVIATYQSGKPDAARELVLTSTGLLLMDHIRLVVAQMEGEEERLESVRATAYERAIQRTIASIYLANFLAVVGLVLLASYMLREINLREKHAQEIRTREEWFRVTLTSIGDAVIATDREGAVTFLNPVAETLTGNDLVLAKGRNILEVFPIINEHTHEPAENPVKKVLEVGHVVGLANHTALLRTDGTQTPIEDSAAPIRDANGELLGVVLVFRDVTSERKAREAMRRTERLAAASRLTATMAHEINNPLQAVASLVYFSRTMPDVPETVVSQLTLVERELQRVEHIVQQTLGFYRESGATESVEMHALVESVFELYSNKLKSKDIRIERRFGDCPPVQAASGELRQVISNLIANAADAVHNQGTIGITLESIEEAGQTMAHILVEDDGPGIPPEYKPRLFEPFFTTKRDVGTGLGLWLTKEIVERHGGRIEVVPRADAEPGAAFSILLPVSSNLSQAAAGDGEVRAFQPSELDGRIGSEDLVQKEE
ncbi:MAG TPA: CHASE3 domain-containing protein [Terracidiphilus sp.]|jgi:PAS domain S-box-containing protein|nr:CHASE3 domain-containing protein [Terracidiphilus sp.]